MPDTRFLPYWVNSYIVGNDIINVPGVFVYLRVFHSGLSENSSVVFGCLHRFPVDPVVSSVLQGVWYAAHALFAVLSQLVYRRE